MCSRGGHTCAFRLLDRANALDLSWHFFYELPPPAFGLDGPSLEVRSEGAVEISPVGEGETKLDYRGHLDVRHRMAGRMRGLFNEIAEDLLKATAPLLSTGSATAAKTTSKPA